MKTILNLLVLASLFSLAANSCANDSPVVNRENAGGLVLLKSEDIRIVQEVLEISSETIRVHYRFRNESDKDIRTMVAFPLPQYPWDWSAIRSDKTEPLKRIFTKVNGAAVETIKYRRAKQYEKDITDELRKIGLSDEQIFEAVAYCDAYNVVPEDTEQEQQAGLVKCGFNTQQVETLKTRHLDEWVVDETNLWEYVFPAHKEVDVVHEYAPHAGFAEGNPFIETATCIDERTKKAINSHFHTVDVGYILKTANNWKGPISDFKLIIKKPRMK
jgi:hypothetical protein